VDFELSEDQLALQKGAADLLDGLAETARVRGVAEQAGQHVDPRLWQAMADQGWLAVEVAAEEGGLGLGAVEVTVLAEQVGRHLAPVPFHGTVLCAGILDRASRDGSVAPEALLGGEPVTSWSNRLAAGEAMGALAWSVRSEALSSARTGGTWCVSGRSDPVVHGPAADVVLAPAVTGEGPALFALAPSTRVEPEPAMDRTRSLGRLVLRDEPAVLVGGADAVESLLDRAATATCAEMLGAAERVLHMTVDYAKDRVQFGRPIGSFQAVKHRCADMLVDVEGMRSSAYYAAWAVGAGDADASAAASAAKVWCSEASRRVMASALQVHGGIGFTWDHDLHFFVKRAQLDQVSFGDARAHRDRLARILRPRAESGLPVL
jgi:alkylation response protein AidB-like acyl-CoA dehydrogenase